MNRVRLLLRGPDPRRQIAGYASQQPWTYDGIIPGKDGNPTEWVWLLDDAHQVHYAESELFHAKFVSFSGPRAQQLAADAAAVLDCWSREELFARWDAAVGSPEAMASNAAERIALAYAMAIAAPVAAAEPRTMERLVQALRDPDPSVRQAAIFAAVFTDWPEVFPAIEELARNDQGLVQRLAQRIIEVHRQQ